jgi:hypothetical protein
LGFVGLSDTLANVIAKVDPARGYLLSPGHGHVTAAFAERSFTLAPSADENQATRLARQALRQDATAVAALSVLGLQAQLRSDLSGANELFGYSQRLSRRELSTHIWAIEESVARGDIEGALKQYDSALRIRQTAWDILFPVLAAAITEPKVSAPLIAMMARGTNWGDFFIRYAAANAPDPVATAQFFRDAAGAGVAVNDADRSRLVNALMREGLADEAWRYYAGIRPNADRRRSRDEGFFTGTDVPAVFDWTVLSPSGLSASIQRGQKDGVFYFSAAPGSGGTVLTQWQLLPPGEYRFEGRSSGIEQPERSRPYWALTCQGGQELGRVPLPSSGDKWATFSGRFTVPSGCSVQILSLVVRPSDAIGGVAGQLNQARLLPAR